LCWYKAYAMQEVMSISMKTAVLSYLRQRLADLLGTILLTQRYSPARAICNHQLLSLSVFSHLRAAESCEVK
jgi:hypothetical protein